jgi:hypothetical protein
MTGSVDLFITGAEPHLFHQRDWPEWLRAHGTTWSLPREPGEAPTFRLETRIIAKPGDPDLDVFRAAIGDTLRRASDGETLTFDFAPVEKRPSPYR